MSRTTVKLSARDYNRAISPDKLNSQAQTSSNKNLVINGGMTVAQRSSSAVAVSDGSNEDYQTLDRFFFKYANSAGGACNINQDTDVPSGYGFTKSYKVDVTTADTSIATNHMISIGYRTEAQDIANCGWVHTSSSSYMTLSFWAKSVKAGTYCVSISAEDSSSTRKFVKEYTLVSNTWKKVEITFPGESGVTVNNDTGVGLDIRWTLQVGTDRDNATNNTWNSADTSIGTSNQVNFFDSTSNNFFLTGVQLEVGDKVTDFEHEPFETTLQKCQRYFCRTYPYGTATGTADTSHGAIMTSISGSQTYASAGNFNFPVEMRAAPSVTVYSTYNANTTGKVTADATDGNGTVFGIAASRCFIIRNDDNSGTGANVFMRAHAIAAAEL